MLKETTNGNGTTTGYKKQRAASGYAPRTLSDYKLQYTNARYPLLSFMYAILAGGEGPLHFDYTDDHAKAYLQDPFGGTIDDCPPHIRRILDKIHELDQRTNNRTTFVRATSEDWDVFLDALGNELKTVLHPNSFW